ncbi:LysR family transcriptional regulator [Ahrensia kielensis]|uniref:LysR family transcriptional regulator n=1 Tax=Ahrensia kielensis TaxID=76980 RepID=UPI000370C31F|nr:LysR family transcriptional regulator [Ahrensia kielensis]
MDHLKALKIFVSVADTQSFSAGAKALGLSAPTATRGVNELEIEIGARLFRRTTRQVKLTEVGKAYLDDVREILNQLQAADDAASGAASKPMGNLRITCPQEFGRIYVAPLVAEFLEQNPDVNADILMVDRNVDLIEEGYDIAVRIGHLPSSGLSATKVGSVRRIICGAPEYFAENGRPEQPNDLIPSHRIIFTTADNSSNEWRFGHDNKIAIKFKPRLTVSSVAASIDIAHQGWGLCRALSYQVISDLEAGLLEPVLIDHEPEPLPVNLVHVEGRKAPAKIRAFINFMSHRLRQIDALK